MKSLLPSQRRLDLIHTAVFDWFSLNQKKLPWRSETPDPYIVLLSEVMLQQTQTSRIAEKLPVFLQQFPTLESLANATNKEIILAWQGLGYNNRALRLRDCAKVILEHHNGIIPNSIEVLRTLPGIGLYTASAIVCFAYYQNVPIVDVNIARIFSRLLRKVRTNHEVFADKTSWEIALHFVPLQKSSQWHQALMDIGSLYCSASSPNCTDCPLSQYCKSAFRVIDVKKEKKKEPLYLSVPRRIWRGKIIEKLRQSAHHTVTSDYLLLSLFGNNYSKTDEQFLHDTLTTLASQELIDYQRTENKLHISLKE